MTEMPVSVEALTVAVVITAAIYDIRFRRIPNWLTVLGLCAGLAANAATGGWEGLKRSVAGFALAFGLHLMLYLVHAMGAGDVKLMGAVGALVGVHNWFPIFVLNVLLGGLAALILIIVRRRVRRTLWNVFYLLGELMRFRAPYMGREELDVKSDKALRLPRGAAIAGGTLTFLAAQQFLM